jgi:hypothetical protein
MIVLGGAAVYEPLNLCILHMLCPNYPQIVFI